MKFKDYETMESVDNEEKELLEKLPNDETVVTTSNQEVFNDQMNSCVLQNEIVNANSFGMFNEYENNYWYRCRRKYDKNRRISGQNDDCAAVRQSIRPFDFSFRRVW